MLKQLLEAFGKDGPLKAYRMDENRSWSAGHQSLWRVIAATSKETQEAVSVFTCDTADLESRCPTAEDARALIAVLKDGAQLLTRLRHPNIVRVLEPLWEDRSKRRMTFVTEPLACCIGSSSSTVADACATLPLSEKIYGAAQCAEAVEFCHRKANLCLVNLSLASFFVAQDGRWKLGDFTFALREDVASVAPPKFRFLGSGLQGSSTRLHPLLSPNLNFAPPETVKYQRTSTAGDIYSFGCCLYELLAPPGAAHLVDTACDVALYRASDNQTCVQRLPSNLRDSICLLMDPEPSCRVTAEQLWGVPLFASLDQRCLRFLPALPSQDTRTKLHFFKDLYSTISSFSPKMIHSYIVPPLLAECGAPEMHRFVLPLLIAAVPIALPQTRDRLLRDVFVGVFLKSSDPDVAAILGESMSALLTWGNEDSAVKSEMERWVVSMLATSTDNVRCAIVRALPAWNPAGQFAVGILDSLEAVGDKIDGATRQSLPALLEVLCCADVVQGAVLEQRVFPLLMRLLEASDDATAIELLGPTFDRCCRHGTSSFLCEVIIPRLTKLLLRAPPSQNSQRSDHPQHGHHWRAPPSKYQRSKKHTQL